MTTTPEPELQRLTLEILRQPDDATCGPTCLQAVYGYYGVRTGLDEIVDSIESLPEGGTLAVTLANHALGRGFRARIYTYNLVVFDPTWFSRPGVDLAERLTAQAAAKRSGRLRRATAAYLEFLRRGGELHFRDLSARLIARCLARGRPILTGLSATYLYGCARETGTDRLAEDDLRGAPTGHFVVLCGWDGRHRRVLVADPLQENPRSTSQYYWVGVDRVIGAILLGVLTYDANLLVLEPPKERPRR